MQRCSCTIDETVELKWLWKKKISWSTVNCVGSGNGGDGDQKTMDGWVGVVNWRIEFLGKGWRLAETMTMRKLHPKSQKLFIRFSKKFFSALNYLINFFLLFFFSIFSFSSSFRLIYCLLFLLCMYLCVYVSSINKQS